MLRTSVEAGLFAALLAVTESMNYRFAAKPVPIPLLLKVVASMLSIEDAFCEEINFVGDGGSQGQASPETGSIDVRVRPSGGAGKKFSVASDYGPAVSSCHSRRYVG